jgi:hypothetical protein
VCRSISPGAAPAGIETAYEIVPSAILLKKQDEGGPGQVTLRNSLGASVRTAAQPRPPGFSMPG